MTDAELNEMLEPLRTFHTDLRHIEVKRSETDLPRTLWQSVSALANTPGGGTIILGIDESSGFGITGVRNAAKLQSDLGTLCTDMTPQVRAAIEPHVIEGKTVLVAEIPETDRVQKPCYLTAKGYTNGAFIRVADGDRKLTTYEVHMMLASHGQPKDDLEPVSGAGREDLDPELVAGLLARLRETNGSIFNRLDDEVALRTLKVMVRDDGQWVPSLGGLLALGKYPQQFFPALGVTFVVYPTPVLGEPGPGGVRFLDNRRFDGPISRMIGPILDALRRNMKRRAIVHGLYREDMWEYPEEAVRESVVNALVHRDLSAEARSTPVQIQMFPERLVILNPGGLFGAVTVEDLGKIGISSARNSSMLKILEDTPAGADNRVVCENRGSGIGAMLAALRRAGMDLPQFEDRISVFMLTFPNETLLDDDTVRWLQSIIHLELSDAQRMALAVMRRGNEVDNADYRRLTGLDSQDARRDLRALAASGMVEQVGGGRWTRYRLAPSAKVTNSAPTGGGMRRDRRPEITSLLRERGELSRAEIAKILGLSDAGVARWLRILRDQKVVTTTNPKPRARGTRYRLLNITQ